MSTRLVEAVDILTRVGNKLIYQFALLPLTLLSSPDTIQKENSHLSLLCLNRRIIGRLFSLFFHGDRVRWRSLKQRMKEKPWPDPQCGLAWVVSWGKQFRVINIKYPECFVITESRVEESNFNIFLTAHVCWSTRTANLTRQDEKTSLSCVFQASHNPSIQNVINERVSDNNLQFNGPETLYDGSAERGAREVTNSSFTIFFRRGGWEWLL